MLHQIKQTLIEFDQILGEIDHQDYQSPCIEIQKGTIGQHTRHIIEFIECLIEGYDTELINYESRKRDLKIECSVQEASRRIHQILDLLDKQDKNLKISYTMDNELFLLETSYFRELIFNFEHCIHHQAFIRIAIDSFMNITLPENFGVSPSTIANRKTICAQ